MESFFRLTPERILTAVEANGRRATGYTLALNSLENRVYEVELEDDSRLVVKFYRPGRWSQAAILAEHHFLQELAESDLPVVVPLDDGTSTLKELATEEGPLHYALFPKVRGRVPEELFDDQLSELGRLLARLHQIGSRQSASDRPILDPESYGMSSMQLLLHRKVVPEELKVRWHAAGQAIVSACRQAWPQTEPIRIHGDCHLGNLIYHVTKERPLGAPLFLDFDDFLAGPPVQDLWLLSPGRDDEALRQRELVVEGYESMRSFDRGSLRLVEPLRGLRILRYSAWIAQRWHDPAFQRTFPTFTEYSYWEREVQTLEEQRAHIERGLTAHAE